MNDRPKLTTILWQNRLRLFIILIVITVIGVGVYLLVRPKPLPTGPTITSSDIALTNTQMTSVSTDKNATFFTGTNQARIRYDAKNKPSSVSLFSERAYENPQRAFYDDISHSLLVAVQYSGQDPRFSLGKLKPGIYWVVTPKTGHTYAVNSSMNQTIDARIYDGVVYGLTTEGDNLYNLYSYNTASRSGRVIKTKIDSNRIVGVTKNVIITQDQTGTIEFYDKQGNSKKSLKSFGSSLFDGVTGNTTIINNDITRKRYKLEVYSESGKKIASASTEYKYIHVSNGYIFGTKSATRPTELAIYQQATLSGTRHPLNLSRNPSKDALIGVTVLQSNPLTIGLVGSSNTMSIASMSSAAIASVPSFQYPYFNQNTTSVGNTTFQTIPGNTDVTLVVNNLSADLDASVKDLQEYCNCDTNQLSKNWQNAQIYIEDAE